MSDNLFHLEIITPEKVLVSGDTDSIEAPGVDGEFQILAGHTPFLTGLTTGPVIFHKSGKKTFVSISGGFCEIQPQKTIVLAHTAELSHEIDKARAEEAKKRAQTRLESKDKPSSDDIDIERAQAALYRAVNRLKIAEMK